MGALDMSPRLEAAVLIGDRPGFARVLPGVIRFRQYLKVLRAIVCLVAVDVVRVLVIPQRSPKFAFENDARPRRPFPGTAQVDVPPTAIRVEPRHRRMDPRSPAWCRALMTKYVLKVFTANSAIALRCRFGDARGLTATASTEAGRIWPMRSGRVGTGSYRGHGTDSIQCDDLRLRKVWAL